MERLTTRTIYGEGCPIQVMTNQVFHNICDRLADIEDILGDNYDLEYLRDLVKSDHEREFQRQLKRFDLDGLKGEHNGET